MAVNRTSSHFRVHGWHSFERLRSTGSLWGWQTKGCWRNHPCICPPNLYWWFLQWWPSSWLSLLLYLHFILLSQFIIPYLIEYLALNYVKFSQKKKKKSSTLNWFLGFFGVGNFLVSKEPPHRPILLDFGLTKKLSSSFKQALAKMFLASAEVCRKFFTF